VALRGSDDRRRGGRGRAPEPAVGLGAPSTREKGSLLNGLRLFLEECPTGEGGIEFGQETVESCCSSYEVVAVTCGETGDRLFEEPIRE